jgi:hypothetical protein
MIFIYSNKHTVASTTAWEADYKPFYTNPEYPNTIFLNGAIDTRSAYNFNALLNEFPNTTTVVLSSPGGDVYSALLIADQVDQRNMITIIPKDQYCYSACSFVYFAGNTRLAEGKLGVHQISSENPDLVSGQITLSDIISALSKYGVATELITKMLKTPPDQMYILGSADLQTYGLIGGRRSKPKSDAKANILAGPKANKYQSPEMLASGSYSSGGLEVIIDGTAVGVTSSAVGCIGQLDGRMISDRGKIAFVADDFGLTCTISVKRLGRFDFSMEEGEGCSSFHGALCSFSGYVRRK